MGFGKPLRATPVRLGQHYRDAARRQARAQRVRTFRFALFTAALSAAAFGGTWHLAGRTTATTAPGTTSGQAGSVHYSGCREARAAGAAPIHVGQPGYRPEMDGDGDGVACEPYRGGDGSVALPRTVQMRRLLR